MVMMVFDLALDFDGHVVGLDPDDEAGRRRARRDIVAMLYGVAEGVRQVLGGARLVRVVQPLVVDVVGGAARRGRGGPLIGLRAVAGAFGGALSQRLLLARKRRVVRAGGIVVDAAPEPRRVRWTP